jgi:hypothetical protein
MELQRKLKEATILESAIGFVAAFILFCWVFLMDFHHWTQILLAFPICISFVVCLGWFVYIAIHPRFPAPSNKTTGLNCPQTGDPATCKLPAIVEELQPSQPVAELTISEKLRRIDWFQFEKLIGLIYQHRGFSLKRLGAVNPDGGVCLINESPNEKFVVQCKHSLKGNVNVRHIRGFCGKLTDSKIPKGIFITLTGYTRGAKQLADKHGIHILKESDVIKMLEESGLVNAKEISELFSDEMEFCPKGEKDVVLRLLL